MKMVKKKNEKKNEKKNKDTGKGRENMNVGKVQMWR